MARNFCFTAFKPTNINDHLNEIGYYIYQTETTKEGKIHQQGYIQLKNKSKFNKIKKIIGEGNHVEKAKGTADENIKYCTKEDSRIGKPIEYGTVSKQGQRSDLKAAAALAIRNMWEEIDDTTYVKYHKGLHKLASIRQKPTERKVLVKCYWGDTGVGKSHRAFNELKDAYWKPPGPWWDDYTGQKDVIIDDFNAEVDCSTFLRWIDKWPLRVPIKGGFVTLMAENIIITSHHNPEHWYMSRSDEVIRRIHVSEQILEKKK